MAQRPYVVVHVGMSVDGATTGFQPDVARFYQLAQTWTEDLTLAGADTILAQEEALAQAEGPGPAEGGPLLAVVDGRGRVTQWEALRDAGHWSDVVALHCASTPERPPGRQVRELVTGADRVDLAEALRALGRDDGVRVVRVDSGGGLTGALMTAGLVDEISLLVHPCLAGERATRFWYGSAPAAAPLILATAQSLPDGLVWLRYHR
ncbi:2,5-diamino-6-(ribosylamino)-4(3H)-pyrimidinone 5'-phosphate reductase [Nonomuraea polychroma]|uniref:2,5-diamino-6-(Ribosylamino)-4(3H)-pyrimidinone 5'-phosphate reductase n=1 Tax=Nonomuraea polychroma TaxID=46176 RepID=A0A438MB16_9ACTN|nr:dihydrofolate reductase family protein [Nonomuraea polychroma]RVX42912.1 2,5-diamino-6-(ribosylamino)-4(3H)-pyrimidinone 5'-phosphate reductase [Nonomuraea polychroma]